MLEERKLEVADRPAGLPVPAYDELQLREPSRERWTWFEEHLAERRFFPDPLVGTVVYPEVSVGTRILGTHQHRTGTIGFASALDIRLFFVDLRLPLLTRLDGRSQAEQVQVDFKLPIPLPGTEHQRLALVWGNGFGGPTTRAPSRRAELLYGLGLGPFAAQLRAAWRLEPAGNGASAPHLGYGALFGYRFGHVQPLLELDGRREFGGGKGTALSLAPGIRFFPGDHDDLQFGLGVLMGLGGTLGRGDYGLRTAGGLADVRYIFF